MHPNAHNLRTALLLACTIGLHPLELDLNTSSWSTEAKIGGCATAALLGGGLAYAVYKQYEAHKKPKTTPSTPRRGGGGGGGGGGSGPNAPTGHTPPANNFEPVTLKFANLENLLVNWGSNIFKTPLDVDALSDMIVSLIEHSDSLNALSKMEDGDIPQELRQVVRDLNSYPKEEDEIQSELDSSIKCLELHVKDTMRAVNGCQKLIGQGNLGLLRSREIWSTPEDFVGGITQYPRYLKSEKSNYTFLRNSISFKTGNITQTIRSIAGLYIACGAFHSKVPKYEDYALEMHPIYPLTDIDSLAEDLRSVIAQAFKSIIDGAFKSTNLFDIKCMPIYPALAYPDAQAEDLLDTGETVHFMGIKEYLRDWEKQLEKCEQSLAEASQPQPRPPAYQDSGGGVLKFLEQEDDQTPATPASGSRDNPPCLSAPGNINNAFYSSLASASSSSVSHSCHYQNPGDDYGGAYAPLPDDQGGQPKVLIPHSSGLYQPHTRSEGNVQRPAGRAYGLSDASGHDLSHAGSEGNAHGFDRPFSGANDPDFFHAWPRRSQTYNLRQMNLTDKSNYHQ